MPYAQQGFGEGSIPFTRSTIQASGRIGSPHMTGFLLAFIGVLLAGTGARDQVLLAALVQSQGARPAVLMTGFAVSIAAAAFAGWAAALVAPTLNSDARLFLAALAVGFAGLEALLLHPPRQAVEPTHSVGALALVLAARQVTDAARFLVFGIALAVNAPLQAAAGGAAGGMVLTGCAWMVPEMFTWRLLRVPRRVIGAALLLVAAGLGLRALGLI